MTTEAVSNEGAGQIIATVDDAGLPMDPGARLAAVLATVKPAETPGTPPGNSEPPEPPKAVAAPVVPPAETPKAEPGEVPPAAPDDTEQVKKARGIYEAATKRDKESRARVEAAKVWEDKGKAYDALPAKVKADPLALLELGGFKSVKEYLDAVLAAGGDQPAAPPPKDPRIDELAEWKRAQEADRNLAEIQRMQGNLFKAVDEAKDGEAPKYQRLSTRTGHERLWNEVVDYMRGHDGECPDDVVWAISDKVDAELVEEFGPRVVAPAAAAPAAVVAAKPKVAHGLTNKMTPPSPAPVADQEGPLNSPRERLEWTLRQAQQPAR